MKEVLKTLHFYIIDLIFSLFIKSEQRQYPQDIAIINLNAIGDYVLLRPFLSSIKVHFPNYKITLIGNKLWKELAESLDSDVIDHFIWIDKKCLTHSLKYRFKTLSEVRKLSFEKVFNFSYSRSFYDDLLIRILFSKNKVGWKGDYLNQTVCQKFISNRFYTQLFENPEEHTFESIYHAKFLDELVKQTQKNFSIEYSPKEQNIPNISGPYIVLFPSAGVPFRKWHITNFQKIISNLAGKVKIIIAGGPGDIELGEQLMAPNVINLSGQIELSQIYPLLSNAKLLLSNETGIVHMAAQVRCPTICISNGNHFGRFHPYPKNISNQITYIYPKEIQRHRENFDYLSKTYGQGSTLDINGISIDSVYQALKQKLDTNNDL